MTKLQFLLPQHLLSNLMYRLTRVKTTWFKNFLIKSFIKLYDVNMTEAANEDIKSYDCFNDFFIRELKKGSRKIAKTQITSPVDGSISSYGRINDGQIFQAKGFHFSAKSLLANNKRYSDFIDGSYLTIYLSPRDYHRIHMPCDGKLIMVEYVPGDLFSVNDKTVSSIDKIFSRNERVVCYFETNFGEVVIILVGAIFVGSMYINSIGQITPPYKKEVKQYCFDEPIFFKKGEEFGRFNMGSTVILLSPGSEFANLAMDAKDAIQMGQALSP